MSNIIPKRLKNSTKIKQLCPFASVSGYFRAVAAGYFAGIPPIPAMSLTDIQLRATKPGLKPFKLSDGGWLYLLVNPAGSKLWRRAYRFEGKERVLSLSGYPELSLKDTRTKRDEAKAFLISGTDPNQLRKADKIAKVVSNATAFRIIADEYLEKQECEGRAFATLNKTEWLLSLVIPKLGDWPITGIKAPDVLAVLKTIETCGNLETANRLRSTIGAIFRYAIATARAEYDPPGAIILGAAMAQSQAQYQNDEADRRTGHHGRALAIDQFPPKSIQIFEIDVSALQLPKACDFARHVSRALAKGFH